jgi:hypothetical protein
LERIKIIMSGVNASTENITCLNFTFDIKSNIILVVKIITAVERFGCSRINPVTRII